MNEIKSLADQLRESIRHDPLEVLPNDMPGQNEDSTGMTKKKKKTKNKAGSNAIDQSILQLLERIIQHELTGKEKQLIRLDDRTIFLLKQLKIARGIDMNKCIAFAVQDFLQRHPELIAYIKENIKTIEL